MASAVRKLLFGSTLLFLLLGAFSRGNAFKPPFVDPGRVRARVVKKLFADHIKSFAVLEGLLQVYLTSYKGVLQESLLVQSRWIDELKGSGDLAAGAFGPEPGTAARGTAAGGYILNGTGKDLKFYIDGNGAFHIVRLIGAGKTRADIVVGFEPLRDALTGMVKKPRAVVLFDEKNGTGSRVYLRGRGKVGIRMPGDASADLRVRFDRIGSVRLSKRFSLDGDELFLVSEYYFPSFDISFILFGLFIVIALAILVMVGTGASIFGGIAVGGERMYGKTGDDDVINEIDRELSLSVSGPKWPEAEKETPISQAAESGDGVMEEAAVSIDQGLAETQSVPEEAFPGGEKGKAKTLENDGIIIKKS